MDLSALSEEFPRNAVHWRPQGTPYERNGNFSCMALAYIDARDVMDRLDAVCGPDRWQSEFCETPKGRMICRIGILTDNGWVWKCDGAGDTDVEGEKGGISDSLKRAAVSWGIGRYLYRLKSPWVGCAVNQKNGKTYWKSWSEDPWAKVQLPDARRPQPDPQPSTAAQEAARRVMDAADKDALRAAVEALPEPIRNDPYVQNAKATRWRQLQEAA